MEKKNVCLWFVVAILLLIPGLWMFYVVPTIWWVDGMQKASWITVATILTGLGAFIILGVSAFIAGGLRERGS